MPAMTPSFAPSHEAPVTAKPPNPAALTNPRRLRPLLKNPPGSVFMDISFCSNVCVRIRLEVDTVEAYKDGYVKRRFVDEFQLLYGRFGNAFSRSLCPVVCLLIGKRSSNFS